MILKFKNISDENLSKFAKEILGYEDLTENLLKSFYIDRKKLEIIL